MRRPSRSPRFRPRPVPLGWTIAFTAFVAAWVPAYWNHYGPANFLWLCDIAVFMTLLGLWRRSALWISAATAGVLLVQAGFALDLLSRLLFGSHLIGGTEYMFDLSIPLGVRLLSLFHLVLPVVQLATLARLGYERRGLWLMTVIMWLVLIPSYAAFADLNMNMVVRPLGREQDAVAPALYFAALFAIYPLLVFLPAHALLRWLIPAAPRSAD